MRCPDEPGDAVVDVDDVTAGGEVIEGHGIPQITAPGGRAKTALLDGAEQFRVAVHRHEGPAGGAVSLPTLAQATLEEIDAAGARTRGEIVHDVGRDTRLLQQFAEASGVLADRDHRAFIGNARRDILGERRQAGQGVGERLHQAGIGIGTPTQDLHLCGHPGVQPLVKGLPVGGRRGEPVGQFAALLAGGALLFVAGLLLLGFAGQTGRAVHDQDRVFGDIVGQGVGVEQAVVEGHDLGVRRGEQLAQLFLEPGNGRGGARRQVDATAALVERRRVAQVGQLLGGGDDAHRVGFADGTLSFGIELTDGVDLIVPELNAVWHVSVGRKHVQDSAAQAEAAGGFDLGFPAVTQLDPGGEHGVDGWHALAFDQPV